MQERKSSEPGVDLASKALVAEYTMWQYILVALLSTTAFYFYTEQDSVSVDRMALSGMLYTATLFFIFFFVRQKARLIDAAMKVIQRKIDMINIAHKEEAHTTLEEFIVHLDQNEREIVFAGALMGASSDRLMRITIFSLASYTFGAFWAVYQILGALESLGRFAS